MTEILPLFDSSSLKRLRDNLWGEDIEALEACNRSNQLQAQQKALESIRDWCKNEQCDSANTSVGCQGDAYEQGYCQALGYVAAICADRLVELGEGE